MKLINSLCTVERVDGDQIQLRLNADHEIYRAHFPGTPVTPGVCLVQMVGELLSQRVGRELTLNRVVNLKFVSVVSPLETPLIEVSFTSIDDDGGQCKVKGTVTANGEQKTKYSLIFVTKD